MISIPFFTRQLRFGFWICFCPLSPRKDVRPGKAVDRAAMSSLLREAIRHLREMGDLGLKPDARSFASTWVKHEVHLLDASVFGD